MKLQEAQRYLAEAGARGARKTLRAKRESVGLSQIALARLSRVPQSNINKIENGKQVITPRAWSRMMTAIEKLCSARTEKSALEKRIADAQARVALCRLPWMRRELSQAEAALAELEAEAQGQDDVFNNPHVKAVMESLQRELERATLPAVEKWVDHDYCESVLRGVPEFVDQQNTWRESGKVMRVTISQIGTVEQEDK